jgi:hypothetical protein
MSEREIVIRLQVPRFSARKMLIIGADALLIGPGLRADAPLLPSDGRDPGCAALH